MPVGDGDDVAQGCAAALKGTRVAAFIRIGVGWVDIRLVTALVDAVGGVLDELGQLKSIIGWEALQTYQCIEEDVECTD